MLGLTPLDIGIVVAYFAVVAGIGFASARLIRNREDGCVEAVLEGSPAAVDDLVAWCRSGPSGASVAGVESLDESPIGERGFRITG